MSNKPIIVVVGSTGLQGGSVARALIDSGEWRVRCLTRNPNSQQAKKLQTMGAEIMKCDCTDREALKKCMDGAYGVFSMTNFYDKETGGMDGENKMGCLIADVAKERGVKHFIWSSLEDAQRLSSGRFKVPMFTSKSKIEDYVMKKNFPITTCVYLGFYMQNFNRQGFKPTKMKDKVVFQFHVPDSTKLNLVNIDDVGPVVHEIFKGKEKYDKSRIPIVGSVLTLKEMVNHYQRATGQTSTIENISKDKCISMVGQDVCEMLEYFHECGSFKDFKDIEMAKKLYPRMTTWDQWVKQNTLV